MKQIHKSTAKALFKSQLYTKHKRGIRICDEMSMAEGKQEISGKWEKIDSKTNKWLQQKHRNIFLVFPLCSLILNVLIQDSLAFCSVSGDLYFLYSWWVEKRNSEWFSCPSECNQSSSTGYQWRNAETQTATDNVQKHPATGCLFLSHKWLFSCILWS